MTKLGLALRLILAALLVALVAHGILWAFTPRWLLLDQASVRETWPLALATFGACAAALAAYVALRVGSLTLSGDDLEPQDLLELFALPSRVALAHVALATVSALVTLMPGVRPPANDVAIQGALVILALTVVSTSALPLYVLSRSLVTRALERAPRETAREAIALLERIPGSTRRVRRRLLAAVAAPVAFVAVGASLLVYAHTRAFERSAREGDARALAAGSLDLVAGSEEGRLDAMLAARRLGFYVDVDRGPAAQRLVSEGQLATTVTLDDGTATVRFDPMPPAAGTVLFVLISLLATIAAAIAGALVGRSLSDDVLLARREIARLGAADVIRGTGLTERARFANVRALRDAIGQLGNVFRQFAAVQERAIDARSATERMRGLFLASMSHDLKGPLNAVLGFAELAQRAALEPAQRESLTIIEQRGRELLALVQTILDSAKVEAGQLELERSWTKVGDVIMAAVLDARDLGGGGDVSAEIQPEAPKLWADSTRLVGALTSIVTSASRIVKGARVVLRATTPAQGERLRIDIEVRGRANVSEERERIFDAFRDPARARRHGSLGLGLWLARSIVKLHGGTLDVEKTEDVLLVFRVLLPVDPDSARTDRWRAQA